MEHDLFCPEVMTFANKIGNNTYMEDNKRVKDERSF